MPFSIPARKDEEARIYADFQARIPGGDTALPVSVLWILSKVWAGSLDLIWRFFRNYWAKQFFLDSAETEYLVREAATLGIVRQGAAAAAGTATASGTNGITIPAGTIVGRSPLYTVQADVTLSSGTAIVSLLATAGGAAGNLPAGTSMSFWTGIAGVAADVVVLTPGLTGGADAESDEGLWTRALARKRQPPQGGAWYDYVAWAKTIPGVTRVWVYPMRRGAGTVDVTFTMDGRASIVPLSGDVTAVQVAIDALRPVTVASVVVFAPAAVALTVAISGLAPGDVATRVAVTAQMVALARTIPPGGAVRGDGVSSTNPGGYLYLSQIEAAVQAAGGIMHFDLTSPSADVVYATGVIPGAVTVTFS